MAKRKSHKGPPRTAKTIHAAVVALTLVLPAFFVLSGCRSTPKLGADSYADADSTGTPETSLVTDQSKQVPEYAKSAATDPSTGETSPFANESSVRLASAKIQRVVPLRTLSVGDDFGEIVSSAPGVVMVDFYADWCGPCRKQGKVLHELESFAAKHQAQIIKVDVDQHKAIAKQFDVGSLPTLVVIKNGKVVDRKVGLTDESRLRSMLQ